MMAGAPCGEGDRKTASSCFREVLMRRHLIFYLSLIAFLLAGFSLARATEVSHARIVRLSYVQGSVAFHEAALSDDSVSPGEAPSTGWQQGLINTPIREGMRLATGDGRAEVEFESGAVAWISSNTVLEFPQLILADGARVTQLSVKQGTASFYVKAGKRESFVVQAGAVHIRVPGSARFRVDIFDDGGSITVLHGSVQVDANGRVGPLQSKTTLTFHIDSPEQYQTASNPARDGWDRWVASRSDAVQTARYDSESYLSSSVDYGAADLSFYGGWMTLPGYGYVWQPWGIGAGWSPFFNGSWSNFGAYGPTWVSYEPWGWLPYHYGGWAHSPFYGWVWVPGRFGPWSPATVSWLRTPQGVGWVPLAPREVPGGAPVNLSHGAVTNPALGMAAQLPNSRLAASALSNVHVVGAWKNDAALSEGAKQAELTVRAQVSSSPRLAMANAIASAWQPGASERMPAGPAPRLSRAVSFQGTVPVYHPPAGYSAVRSAADHWGSSGLGGASNRGAGPRSAASAGSAAGASHANSAPAPSSASAGGARGGGGKP